MKFSHIPQLIPAGGYEVNVPLDYLEEKLEKLAIRHNLNLLPDFQRGHVWSQEQQVEYVEYFLQGGRSGMVIYFNKPSWRGTVRADGYDDFVIVDGLQRLTAMRRFLRGEIRAFGCLVHEFEDDISQAHNADELKFNINSLETRQQVLQWYYQMNSGGTPHPPEELARVKKLLDESSL